MGAIGEDDEASKVILSVGVVVSVGISGADMVQSSFWYIIYMFDSFFGFMALQKCGNFDVTFHQSVYAQCVPVQLGDFSLKKYIIEYIIKKISNRLLVRLTSVHYNFGD